MLRQIIRNFRLRELQFLQRQLPILISIHRQKPHQGQQIERQSNLHVLPFYRRQKMRHIRRMSPCPSHAD